jgi:hypothetical protein
VRNKLSVRLLAFRASKTRLTDLIDTLVRVEHALVEVADAFHVVDCLCSGHATVHVMKHCVIVLAELDMRASLCLRKEKILLMNSGVRANELYVP